MLPVTLSLMHSIYCLPIDVYRNQNLSVNSPVEVSQARGVSEALCERIAVDFQFRYLEEKLFTELSGNKGHRPRFVQSVPLCCVFCIQ
jgi:hypothetical protein